MNLLCAIVQAAGTHPNWVVSRERSKEKGERHQSLHLNVSLAYDFCEMQCRNIPNVNQTIINK